MFSIQKGINLSHWLSQVFGWSPRPQFITQQDILFIKQAGFDHVRLPVDEEQLWHEDFTKNTQAFADMHACIQWCIALDLRVVVDMHILRSHHFNNANNEGAMTLWENPKEQDHMMEIWRILSAELKHYSEDMLAYEFMNEPVAPKHHYWNELVARGHSVLRELEPTRTLIFGPNLWQIPKFFESFEIPRGDANIILSFHTYDPLPFTHYKAPWMPLGDYTGPVVYPGTTVPDEFLQDFIDANGNSLIAKIAAENRIFTKESMCDVIAPALEFAKKTGLRLYCNEFGCLPTVTRSQRLQYYTDLIDVLQSHNIAYAAWDYKGDFGIRQWDKQSYTNGEIDNELVGVLVKNK